MLLDFTFSNFKCFVTDQQFTMCRPKADQDLQPEGWSIDGVSTVAGVFGGNASGKSSFLEALLSLSCIVSRSVRDAERNPGFSREYFLLDQEYENKPTDFFIDFIGIDNNRYQYQLSFNDVSVLYESLRVFKSRRSSVLYERELSSDDQTYLYKYGTGFTGARKTFEKMVRKDVTYLSVLHDMQHETTESAFQTLSNQIRGYQGWAFDNEIPTVIDLLDKGDKAGLALASIMTQTNLGLLSMELENETSRFLKKMSTPGQPAHESLKALIGEFLADTSPDLNPDEMQEILSNALASSPESVKTLVFAHHGKNGDVLFEKELESRGTLSSLAFFSMALRVLSSRTVCVVDELDMSLHPRYVRELVRLFRCPDTNPNQSQMIFSSHDVTLMSNLGFDQAGVLDRDQIWFTEKDLNTGEAELFPLTELSVRRKENYMRNYLNGIYGALPDPQFHGAFANAIKASKAME